MFKADSGKNIAVTQSFIDKLIDKISNILKEQHALKETDEEQTERIESLLNKVSSIENNFDELTKSLARGSYPIKLARSIKVAESKITPQITPVAINKAELIVTYNEIAALLSGYTIPVNLTPDSYRGINSNEIVLETTVKGNYWAICTQKEKEYKYWLVPNNNLSFNVHKIKTVENLFQFKGDYNSPNSNFFLEEPAVLSLLPNNKQWKLIQPGVLIFGSNLQSRSTPSKKPAIIDDNKQAKINEQTLSSLTTFQKTIEQLTNKVTQLEIQAEISNKTYQREQKDLLLTQEFLAKQLKKISTLQLPESELYNENKTDKIQNQNLKIDLKTQISQFRQAYIQDRKLINDLIVAKVAISVETLEQITFYKPDRIILENTPHGKYWIINYSGNHFLIPSEIEQITNAKETSLTVARLLFHLSGYYPQYSIYHLIRPAIVTKISPNQWKLKEKGKFNFS